MYLSACTAGWMLAATLTSALPARAQDAAPQPDGQERVEIDTNLFCDTSEQVERFVTLLDQNGGSAEAAMAAVNQENKAGEVCVIATVAYRRAGVASTVKNKEATFDVTRVMVIGVYTVNGLERALPTEFFTLVARSDEGTVGRGAQ